MATDGRAAVVKVRDLDGVGNPDGLGATLEVVEAVVGLPADLLIADSTEPSTTALKIDYY